MRTVVLLQLECSYVVAVVQVEKLMLLRPEYFLAILHGTVINESTLMVFYLVHPNLKQRIAHD